MKNKFQLSIIFILILLSSVILNIFSSAVQAVSLKIGKDSGGTKASIDIGASNVFNLDSSSNITLSNIDSANVTASSNYFGYAGSGGNYTFTTNQIVNGYLKGDSTDGLRLAASSGNGNIYFVKSDGSTVVGRFYTSAPSDSETVEATCTEAGGSGITIVKTQTTTKRGQIFKSGNNYSYLTSITVQLWRSGSPTGNAQLEVYTVNPVTKKPVSLQASSSTYDISGISTNSSSPTSANLTFSSPPAIYPRTFYAFVLTWSSRGGGDADYIGIRSTGASSFSSCEPDSYVYTTDNGSSWTLNNPYSDNNFLSLKYTAYTKPASGILYMGKINTASSDLAENYPSSQKLEHGDVVALDSSNHGSIVRTNIPYDRNLSGVISTSPGYLLNNPDNGTGNQFPVALMGKVPVKVLPGKEGIRIGDPLTSSEIGGFAKKANHSGYIIAKALESSDKCTSDSSPCRIMAFISKEYYVPEEQNISYIRDQINKQQAEIERQQNIIEELKNEFDNK